MSAGPKQVIVVPHTIGEESLAELREAGFIPIRTANPDGVKIVMPSSEVISSDLLMAAMHGLCSSATSSAERSLFTNELHRRLKFREEEAELVREGR